MKDVTQKQLQNLTAMANKHFLSQRYMAAIQFGSSDSDKYKDWPI